MEGVFTAIVTPFDEERAVDRAAFSGLLDLQEGALVPGIVIGGTTGEGWSLSLREVEVLFELARARFSGKVILGTGAMSTREAIEKAEHAKGLGADAGLVVVPYYNLPSEAGVIKHYEAIAKTGLPIIVYHHPKRTGVCLSIECLEKIADIKGVIAIKETVEDVEYYRRLSLKTAVFSGCDDRMKEAKSSGARGVISVVSNLCPEEAMRFFASNEKDCSWIFKDLVAQIFKEGNPAGIKRALKKKNYCSDLMRAPLLGLTDKGIQELEKLMDEMFFKEIANK